MKKLAEITVNDEHLVIGTGKPPYERVIPAKPVETQVHYETVTTLKYKIVTHAVVDDQGGICFDTAIFGDNSIQNLANYMLPGAFNNALKDYHERKAVLVYAAKYLAHAYKELLL